jgi:hypothetical protein
VQAGRDDAVTHRQQGLDQARDAGGAIEMTDVGLDRAQGAETGPAGARPKGAAERRHLDAVAERRAGAVSLDEAHGLRLDARVFERLGDHPRLAVEAGCAIADLQRAVVVDRRATDHRHHRIAVGERLGQALEQHDAGAVAEGRAAGLGVEGPAPAVGRGEAACQVAVAGRLRHLDRHPAGEGHVTLVGEQAGAGEVDRDQRGRAEGLHGEAGARQVELVGGQRGERVALVADTDLEVAERSRRLSVGRQVAQQVMAGARAGKEADRAGVAERVVAARLESLPGAFQEDPVLRVHDLGLARVEAEEGGVEQLDVLQHAACRDV